MSINFAPTIIIYAMHLKTLNECVINLQKVDIFSEYSRSEISFNFDRFVSSLFTFTGFENKKNKLKTIKENGIIASEIERERYFTGKLEVLLKDFYELLTKLKDFRNKYQHNPDKLILETLLTCDDEKIYYFTLPRKPTSGDNQSQKENIIINLMEIIKLTREINSLFGEYLENWILFLTETERLKISKSTQYGPLLSKQYYLNLNSKMLL